MGASSGKKNILSEKILNAANAFIRTSVSDPSLTFVSITRVELSDDLSNSKLYWDTFDASRRGDSKKAILAITGKLRTHLSKLLKMRHVPTITFVYDSQYDEEKKIEDLLDDEAKKGKGIS
ncbi:ribosome-binding factor A [Halobacteriovorax marinus SJ]|uniref:Ribosome-binding factor A n=1 Tax=Halobacteriovorax marinus (strain ATCC BAA-682 / DSM 15412 / SJ) TaxID=862908 RepID=E1X219_HALMS|nr:30S ribosome-binding factor RbfA [Halobacteriovorax marinus]CBW26679.1 ribosome-binding factor A [Halobacteriovorax marinus SJ]